MSWKELVGVLEKGCYFKVVTGRKIYKELSTGISNMATYNIEELKEFFDRYKAAVEMIPVLLNKARQKEVTAQTRQKAVSDASEIIWAYEIQVPCELRTHVFNRDFMKEVAEIGQLEQEIGMGIMKKE